MVGLGLFLAVLPGCVAMAVVGASSSAVQYMYKEGEVEREYDAPMERTWNATLHALDDLAIRVTEKVRSRGEIDGRLYTGKTVKLKLEPRTEEVTRVKIRIGTFGDQRMSDLIGNAIQKQL